MDYLAFEQPIADLEAEIKKLEQEEPPSAATAEKVAVVKAVDLKAHTAVLQIEN